MPKVFVELRVRNGRSWEKVFFLSMGSTLEDVRDTLLDMAVESFALTNLDKVPKTTLKKLEKWVLEHPCQVEIDCNANGIN